MTQQSVFNTNFMHVTGNKISPFIVIVIDIVRPYIQLHSWIKSCR